MRRTPHSLVLAAAAGPVPVEAAGSPLLVGMAIFFCASFLAGAVTRRLSAVVLAAVAAPAYFAGLLLGLWGTGVGESWQYSAVGLTLACAAGGVAGLLSGRALAGPP